MFTDIEGSTKVLHELGADAYAEALAEHSRLLRAAFDRHGGIEVDTQGDAFFYAFADAREAVTAAEEGREAGAPARAVSRAVDRQGVSRSTRQHCRWRQRVRQS